MIRTSFYPQGNTGKEGKNYTNKKIYMRISIKGMRPFKLPTKLYVPDLNYWNKKLQRPMPKKCKSPLIKARLEKLERELVKLETKVDGIYEDTIKQDPDIPFEDLKESIEEQLVTGKQEPLTFFNLLDLYIQAKEKTHTFNNIEKIKNLKKHLMGYQESSDKKIRFKDINKQWGEFFISYLNDKGIYNNTANKITAFLKTFLNWAVENKYTNETDFKYIKLKAEKIEVIFLEEHELQLLKDVELSSRLDKIRDLFLFQIYTGQRFSDLIAMKKTDIVNSTWMLRTKKTKDINEIPLDTEELLILAKYNDTIFENALPLISNQKYNDNLKLVCEEAGIDSPVTIVRYKGNEPIPTTKPKFEFIGSHTARRTFISLSLKRGMPISYIMAVTGHKNLKTLQAYSGISQLQKRNIKKQFWGDYQELTFEAK